MASTKSSRQDAKASATGQAQASGSTPAEGSKRRPGERAESENQASQEAAAPPQNRDLIVIADNPKRKGTKAYGFFEKYPRKGVMSSIDAARYDSAGKELVRGKDLSWDAARRHILVGEEATNFPVNGTREEQCKYLLGLPETDAGFTLTEAQMIKWGYMDAPVEEPAAEAEQKTEATAS